MKIDKNFTWQFKNYFRSNAYGWRGSAPAAKRLREAVSEIRKTAKKDPILGGEGVITLAERIWPAFQRIDTSSGMLGSAVNKAIDTLLPVLIDAPTDLKTRRKWLDRLSQAVQNDGVDYLWQIQAEWGRICRHPELVNEWAEMSLSIVHLSCLLEAGRYDEIDELLSLRSYTFWPDNRYKAEALVRQGKIDEAIAYAQSLLEGSNYELTIMRFCEDTLLKAGRSEEAYQNYSLILPADTTHLNRFRSLLKKYPDKDPRSVLLDLIDLSGDKGAWFASARQYGFPDIAMECAMQGTTQPQTLVRAARDLADSQAWFARDIALRALDLMLQGYGYELTVGDVVSGFYAFKNASEAAGGWPDSLEQLNTLLHRSEPQNYVVIQECLEKLVRNYSILKP
ncbi:MAG: hypothetical protein PHT33_10375 [bacterium]|nr:hypothetical protein [bacterium]